jgi:hypothetical protein
MKKLIFAPAMWNMAETTRCLEVAKACRDYFDCIFISYGGMYERLVKEEGFHIHELSPRLTEEKIAYIYKVDKGEELGTFFTDEELHQRVDGEVAYLKEVGPAAVITGFCLSIPISARVARVPLVTLIGACWTENFFKEGLGTWPDMLDFAFLRWVPHDFLDWLGNKVTPFLWDEVLGQFSKVGKKYGLKKFRGCEYFLGDHSLLAEPPEFAGLKDLPPNCHYIGPLIARLRGEIPPEILSLPKDKPLIWFAMGSSGTPEIVAEILSGFAGKPYSVVSPVRSLLEKLMPQVPENVVLTDFLPAHKVNPMADLSVIHGGIGTVMTACLSGTPVVGVGMQPEQEVNLECLVRKGFAIRISKRHLTAGSIIEAVDKLLGDEEAKRKAKEFQKIVEQWDGPANAAKFMRETFGET